MILGSMFTSSVTRGLLLCWLAFHLLTMTVSLSKGSAFHRWMHPYTDWYQWRVGIHQNWSMFAPNPRLSTVWLEFEGVDESGGVEPIPMVSGTPDPHGWILRYARAGKLERNAVARKHIRASYVRFFCGKSRSDGHPYRRIQIYKLSQPTIAPALRAHTPRSEWPTNRTLLEDWNCPR